MREINYGLYLVTDDCYLNNGGVYSAVDAALQAGVTALQYRAKGKNSREMLQQAGKFKELCVKYNIPLIINDRLDIALAVAADGVHLGQDDLPLAIARRLAGDMIIGVSATSYDEGREAIVQGADYIGIGPIFETATKKAAKPPCGLEVIRRLKTEFSAARLVAIGGIDLDNFIPIITAGAEGIAVVSAILGSRDPRQAARAFALGLGGKRL